MTLAEPAILVQNLTKIYRERSSNPVRALDGLDLTVSQGEIFGLLGRNGAGKTTLLRILTTLSRPTSGTVKVMGTDVWQYPRQVREHICIVLQENAVELYLSVADNFVTYGRFQSIPTREALRRAGEAMELFGLEPYRNQKVIDLSGGLKRRVQVAKVFMAQRPVVFLDEATTGMDPINKRATLDAIREEARKGRTIFLTTHVLEEAEELCDTIALIDKGRCVASGDLRSVKALASPLMEISITFGQLSDETEQALRRIPSVKFTRRKNTVEMTVRGTELSVIEAVARAGAFQPVVHLEITSATLEDVFFELLGKPEKNPS